jgi:DNA repair exonuclease SbcCD nuclease subunit
VIEGATVGPADFTFRSGDDVIPGSRLPEGFAAVLSGHIHRHQTIDRDPAGRRLPCPVVYPGSTQPTSFAERDERKGYVLLEVAASRSGAGRLRRWSFVELPSRPMIVVDIDVRSLAQRRRRLDTVLRCCLGSLDPESIVRLRFNGPLPAAMLPALRAAALRDIAPAAMNVHLDWRSLGGRRGRGGRRPALAPSDNGGSMR